MSDGDWRAYNFSAGPSTIADEVLKTARDELLDYRGLGASIMELSHRGPDFMEVATRCEANLRRLMQIPDDYAVIFMQGGATLQASAVAANLIGSHQSADYIDTGHWSQKAIRLGADQIPVNVVASAAGSDYRSIPDPQTYQASPQSAYLHITTNETIHGLQYHRIPKGLGVPLVADMSSDIVSAPIEIQDYGLIYAGAQKNIGPAGITLVVVRRDLLQREVDSRWPAIFRYKEQLAADSMLNTPPTLSWYLCGLTIENLLSKGGLPCIAALNQRKATLLYDFIDQSAFFSNFVELGSRSLMNVPFDLADPARDQAFLEMAKASGMLGLKGHKARGGMRASLYNAMPIAGVEALVELMAEFERNS